VRDRWIFDPFTQLWQVPGGFSDIQDNGNSGDGRWMHTMEVSGNVIVMQGLPTNIRVDFTKDVRRMHVCLRVCFVHCSGGSSDDQASTASPTIMKLSLNGQPQFSYPWLGFPSMPSSNLIGKPSNCVRRTFAPITYNLSMSQILTMGPVSISAPLGSQWTFLDGADSSLFYRWNNTIPQYPVNSSWNFVGQVQGHRSVLLGDSIFYVGGSAALQTSNFPYAISTFVSAKAIRASTSPICSTVAPCLDPTECVSRQVPSSDSSICFLCSKGSYMSGNFSNAKCVLCGYGSCILKN
jgi:hypothetical protein